MEYRVTQNYKSAEVGPFTAGQVLEIDDDMAAWVNHDAPGTLVEHRSLDTPPNDRMVRKGARRNET